MGIITCLLNFILSFQISSNFKNFSILFIAFFGFIVLNIEVLSLFKMINGENILILTLIEFLIVHLYWLKKKKPVCLPNFKGFLVDLKKAFVEDKSLIILSLFWLFMVGVSFILSTITPATEADAQSYHCLRSLYWALDNKISHFEITDVRNHIMPINSELFYVWILALFKKDTLFGLLQFCSYFLLLFSSFNIMEFYNIEFKKRIWALIIFSSFAGVISQISSTQTDLCVGALLSCSIYLIHCYIKDKRLSLLFFSSLCMGLSFGVKSTGVIGSIPLIIWYIVLLRKDFIKYFIFLCFNFIVFSSYNYILNFINYGNFLGSNSALLGHGFWGGIKGGIANFIRYIFDFIDLVGLYFAKHLEPFILNSLNNILNLLNIPNTLGVNYPKEFINFHMNEQIMGLGALGFILFLPSVLIGLFKKSLRIFSLIFIFQLIVLSFSIAYMVYSIRFLITFVAISIPLISLTYIKKSNLYKIIAILFAIYYMGYTSLYIADRPFVEIFKQLKNGNKIEVIQSNLRNNKDDIVPDFYNQRLMMKKFIEPICKNNNKIGVFIPKGFVFYPSKYLEINNSCKIDSLNSNRINNYNLQEYNYLLTQKDYPQKTTVINKKDTIVENNNKYMCNYFEMGNNLTNDISKATYGVCAINRKYLRELGFIDKEILKMGYVTSKGIGFDDIINTTYILWEKN